MIMKRTPFRLGITDRLLSYIEHPKLSDRLFLRILFFVALGSLIYFFIAFNNNLSEETPARGGVIKEGIVGIPRFVNPALALTRADQDTVALLYSGLLKIDETGNLVPDLAEKVEVSEDGEKYHVVVAKDKYFHDGTPITARDVIFTIELIQDPDLKSPLRGNWSDVVIQPIDDYEFDIILVEPYAPFIENFTLGIMPSHIWSNLPIEQLPFSQYNTEPIGSGPFMINHLNRDASGLISSYILEPSGQNDSEVNLSSIELKFYQNESFLHSALTNGEINATIFMPTETIRSLDNNLYNTITEPLPRIFAIFINQNRSVPLRDKSARQALSAAIDRNQLIVSVLDGYGVPTTKPTVDTDPGLELEDTAPETALTPEEILTKGGWKKNDSGLWEKKIGENTETLAVTIKTGNSSLFDETANFIADSWRKIGVEVQVEEYEQTGLVQSVIRTRDFQTLLFGLDMNRQQDLYPFWHSSQKDDPGLNISQYTNVTVDRLLESIRNKQDQRDRANVLEEISNTIIDEVPAIFLFAPSISYVTTKDIETAPISKIGRPADRFMSISAWHARTETVWSIFQNK